MKRLVAAFHNSVAGFRYLFKNEAAFKQECLLLLIAILPAYLIAENLSQFFLLLFVIMLIMIVEVLNTAIEAVCDALTTEFNAQIKIAKDCGSLAVLMACGIALVVWGLAIIN